MDLEVAIVRAADCHGLRRRVLRDDDPEATVVWAEDERPGAFHLGVREHGRLVAVASFSPSPTPLRPGLDAWQLRGMAVEPGRQRAGLGRLLLDEARRRLRALGAEVLWANARDTALGFYVGQGFHVIGGGFPSTERAIPHHTVLLDFDV